MTNRENSSPTAACRRAAKRLLQLAAGAALSLMAAPGFAQSASELVLVERGTLPILLTAPHGGSQDVPGVPERIGGTLSGDTRTFELTEQIADEIEARLGGRPYRVMARFHRKFIDANRAAGAAFEDPDARSHYEAYHEAVREFVDELRSDYPAGHAVLYDIHGQSKFRDEIHRGTRNGQSVADLRSVHGDAALIGPDSVFGRLADRGFAVFPDGTPIGSPDEDRDLNGAFSVTNYGSHNADGIDTIQIEVGIDLREPAVLPATATGIADAIARFTRVHAEYGLPLLTQGLIGEDDGFFDGFGGSVASGDFDGDGRDDLAVGSPGEDVGSAANAGSALVFYGADGGLVLEDAETLTQESARATSETGDRFGHAMVAGDFNRDGFDDLAVSAPYEDDKGVADTGVVSIFLGSKEGLLPQHWERFGQEVTGAARETGDRFGWALAAGDFDDDGYDDLAVGMPYEDYQGARDAGVVVLLRGSSRGLLPARWERFGQEVSGAAVESGDRFGSALAAGDFDRDGYDDLAIGMPNEDYRGAVDAGVVVSLRGSAAGLIPARWERFGQEASGASVESGDRFGAALASGDFDGDGHDDLAVGMPGEDYQGARDAGLVVGFYGSTRGLIPARFERFGQELSGAAVESDDRFASALCSADFDGDGRDDLAIGVPGEDVGGARDTGMVVVMRGSGAGLVPARSQRLGQTGLGARDESGDALGMALASGDFDGDGRADLAAAAPGEEVRGTWGAGMVGVFRGSAGGLSVRP